MKKRSSKTMMHHQHERWSLKRQYEVYHEVFFSSNAVFHGFYSHLEIQSGMSMGCNRLLVVVNADSTILGYLHVGLQFIQKKAGHFVFLENAKGLHSVVLHACRRFLSPDPAENPLHEGVIFV